MSGSAEQGASRPRQAYQYVVLRCVPAVEREEFLNVGVVLYAQTADFLEAAWHLDEARLRAIDSRVDLERLHQALEHVGAVCSADALVGAAADPSSGQRFGFLKAPRSTIVQPGPVHGGLTEDPARQLEYLLRRLVG